MSNIDDISMKELKEKAKVIAEGTGRSYESVLEDLLDDGVVNLSNEQKKDGSLVDQLKEAAELIAAVQQINHQVADNTVLNGKDTKTEVNVESTLEGDLIDRAIDSVQRKADNIKKILITLAPVFLLLTGGSLEAIGLIDLVGDDSDDHDDGDSYIEYGGCTASDADNYDPDASFDDGSCYWDDNNGGGGGPPGPTCNEDWRWSNVNIRDSDMHGQGFNNDIEIDMDFEDWNDCNRLMSGAFILQVWNEDANSQYDSHEMNPEFRNDFHLRHTYQDLPAGDYSFSVSYFFDGSEWGGPSQLVTIEGEDSTLDIQNAQLSIVGENELKAEFDLLVEGDFCCEDIEIVWEVQMNGYYDDGLKRFTQHSYDEKGYIKLEQYWNDMPDGNYHVRIEVKSMDEVWDEETTNGITIEAEPDPCDADIDNLQITVDEAAVTVMFYIAQQEDTDCDSWDVQIELLPQDTGIDSITHQQGISNTSNYYSHTFEEVGNAVWKAKVTLIQSEQGIIAEEETDWITVSYSDEPDEPCDAEIINHYRGHVSEDAEQDAILVAFRVVPNEYCTEGVEIDLWLQQPGQSPNYSHSWELDDPSQAEDFTHTFDGVAIGNSWTPVVTAYNMEDDQVVEQISMWGIDIVEPEPEICEINLFDIQIGTNSTHAQVAYDLDCGTNTNDLDGYNVTVQFLVYDINSSTAGTQPLIWVSTVCYIQGYEDDVRIMTLTNFTHDNVTTYDFYWYATWIDGEGESQTIEQKWLNRSLNP